MKLFIASDIHGSAKYCRAMLEAFNREGADKLIILGDVLYHGPRNPLPEEYSPQSVVEMLSEVKDKVICLRGNCDADIDLMLLPFPLSEHAYVLADGINICLSHGDKQVPPLGKDDVYITGHTHVALNTVEEGGYRHLNPGSVSLPKEGGNRGYILYQNRKFAFKTLEGERYDVYEISGGTANVVKHNTVVRRKIVRKKI